MSRILMATIDMIKILKNVRSVIFLEGSSIIIT
jgi:hypothetical protein